MILENKRFKAKFSALGAELQSFEDIKIKKNYIWEGNPQYWGKHSPILFPNVGALKGNTYIYEGQTYTLPRHGFARECTFEIETHTETELIFLLKERHANYPLPYELRVIYRLFANGLSCIYQIKNPSADTALWYSVGAHPAFAIETNEDVQYSDYYLKFENDTQLQRWRVGNGGLISTNTELIPLQDGKLPLSYALFYTDALVLKNLKSESIILGNTKNPSQLRFTFENMPYFGIWAAKNADFVCLEPWAGIADAENHNQDWKQKEGILEIQPQTTQTHSWSFYID